MRFSVLTAVCDPPIDVLAACLDSVRSQTHLDVEHVLVDDASTSDEVRELLVTTARSDQRVTLIRRESRGGIVAASNDALAAASGEFIALLDHDDVLAAHALVSIDDSISPTTDVVYGDHDHIRPDGRYANPVFKPDFSLERLRQQNYITHFVVARRSLVDDLGGFRPGFDGAQDHDLLLRLCEQAREIVHVPEVLYHWRMTSGSVALDPTAKEYAYERGRRAVAEHHERVGIAADVRPGAHLGTYRVNRTGTIRPVSVIIAAAGRSATVWGRNRPHLGALLDSLFDGVDDIGEVLVAVPDGVVVTDSRVRVVTHAPDESPFRVALEAVDTDVILMLDEAMLLDEGSRLDQLTALLDDDVAAVGGAQFRSDGCIHHGGFVVQAGSASPILSGWHRSHGGPGRLMDVTREVGAIDLVGSAWRTEHLHDVLDHGGQVETARLGVLASVRARAAGSRVLWTPLASFLRVGGVPAEAFGLDTADHDPYYNPNLVAGRADWLEVPGRAGAPPYVIDDRGHRHWS